MISNFNSFGAHKIKLDISQLDNVKEIFFTEEL